MKGRKGALFLLGLALLAGLIMFWFTASPSIVMQLVESRRWPHGAIIRRSNHMQSRVYYFAESDATPGGRPLLRMQKIGNGWEPGPFERGDESNR